MNFRIFNRLRMGFPTLRPTALASAIIATSLISPPALASPQATHYCLTGASSISIDGKANNGKFIAIYHLYPGQTDRAAFSAYPDDEAKNVGGWIPRTGSNIYSAHGVTIDARQSVPPLAGVNGKTISCRAQSAFAAPEDQYFDGLGSMFGVSMGSTIRSGPDIGQPKIGKFNPGRPVTINANTKIFYEKYVWFEVLLGKNQLGYIWGGTLCLPLETVDGSAECPKEYGGRIETMTKTASSSSEGIPGQSTLGTRIRKNPDQNSPIIGGLPVGAPLHVIGETGSFFDTFQWVKVRTSNNVEGYAWGGSICTSGKEVVGVHYPCQ